MKKSYFLFLLFFVFLTACKQNNNSYYEDGCIETEVIDLGNNTLLIKKYHRDHSLREKSRLVDNKLDGVMKTYYRGSRLVHGEIYYEKGVRKRAIAYKRSGAILQRKFYDNRDKLDSILRFMLKADSALNKVFIVDSTQQMKITKRRLQKFNTKYNFEIVNDSIINVFNRLNKEKTEIVTLLKTNGFRIGSVSDLLHNNSFEWDYVRDSLGIEMIVNLSNSVYFTKAHNDYVFIYISTMQSGAVGYAAFYLILIKEDGFEVVKEFPDFVA